MLYSAIQKQEGMGDEEAMEKEAKSSKLKKVPFTWCESTRGLKREGR